MADYVHGYDHPEGTRLQDQANALENLVHDGTRFPPGSLVLEAGCGVGAQTGPLCQNSPGASIIAVDIAAESLHQARSAAPGCMKFAQANLYSLPFDSGCFDHAFVCFVLEHLSDPGAVLAELRRVVKPGGTLTAIEGDHGSTLFHPNSEAAHAAIACQISLQAKAGGDALIGRQLYPLLTAAGFIDVRVRPLMVYVDASTPQQQDGFIRKTFTAMIEGVRSAAISRCLISAELFDEGIAALHRTAAPDGMFGYTFFKATCSRG